MLVVGHVDPEQWAIEDVAAARQATCLYTVNSPGAAGSSEPVVSRAIRWPDHTL